MLTEETYTVNIVNILEVECSVNMEFLFFFTIFFALSVYAADIFTWSEDQDVPTFRLEQLPGSFNLTVEPGKKVIATMCYRKSNVFCDSISPSTKIDPSLSRSVVLNFPYLLPCVCVQVYYTHLDAMRTITCPFMTVPLGELAGHKMWNTSKVVLFGTHVSSILFNQKFCPHLRPSASLCWKHHERAHLCTAIPNSSLEMIGPKKYNVSAVDKHHQMCVQFSVQGSHHFWCPFQTSKPLWRARFGPAKAGLRVYLTSTVPASFSAQLCVRSELGCAPRGEIYSENSKGGMETQIYLPLGRLNEGLCVQVWRSDPFQLGRRILCDDSTHLRLGLIPVAALTLVVTLFLLGCIAHHMTRKEISGWVSIQRPVLLVCSSDQPAHVTAVCTLASILQGELHATVHSALWAQTSAGRKDSSVPGTGVADLGPLPWLHGQWDAVRAAKGKVLFAWSPEATESYECWVKEREAGSQKKRDKEEEEGSHKRIEDLSFDRELLRSRGLETDPSSVTGPVFRAALSRLCGLLQEGSGDQGAVLVSFKGLGHSRDIPKELRDVPRYRLPRDFHGLIQELDGTAAATIGCTPRPGPRCWPRLRSETHSLRLARKLAGRLQEKLPQAHASSGKNKGGRGSWLRGGS